MKNKKVIVVAFLILALIVWMASFAFAATNNPSVVPPVAMSDLGVSSTGLLPSNPFYFSEEWMRNIQKVFATDLLSKSQLELQILNDKAAELLTASGIAQTDTSIVEDAVSNYGNELQAMAADVQLFNTKNADTDSFLSNLVVKLFMHYQLLESVKAEYGDSNGGVSSIQNQIVTVVDEVPAYLSDSSHFGSVLNSAVTTQTDLGAQLRSLPFIDALEEANTNPLIRAQLDQVKQGQVLAFEGRYDADGLSSSILARIFEELPVRNLSKFMIVNDLQQFAVGNNLGLELSGMKDAFLASASSSGEISSSDVSGLINYANSLIAEAKNEQQPISLPSDVSTLLSKAGTDLSSGLYGIAFSEASSAASAIDNILFNIDQAGINSESNITSLSNKLTTIQANALAQGLTEADDSGLFSLISNATSILSGNPSVGDITKVEEYINAMTFALSNAQEGYASALIPVLGVNDLRNSTNTASSSSTSEGTTPRYCSETYVPVCGSDGITYPNQCLGTLVGASTTSRGACSSVQTGTSTNLVQP